MVIKVEEKGQEASPKKCLAHPHCWAVRGHKSGVIISHKCQGCLLCEAQALAQILPRLSGCHWLEVAGLGKWEGGGGEGRGAR